MIEVIDAKVEFRNFYILLAQNKWFNKIANQKELEKIISTCNKNDTNTWKYNLTKFEFKNINIDRHTRPLKVNKLHSAGLGFAKVLLSVSCNCNSVNNDAKIEDPIIELATKLVIQFEYIEEGKPDEFKVIQSSWHLDKHSPDNAVESSHPLYHYEFGGTEINKDIDFNFGDFFLIDTPRIMHPPLDIVLAIDFIIKNYYKKEDHISLTGQKLYKRYIKNAQLRIWKPYAISFASNFHDFGEDTIVDGSYSQNILHCE